MIWDLFVICDLLFIIPHGGLLMKKVFILVSLLVLVTFLAGCGETVNGAIKDTKRIGGGIKKVFVRDSS